MAREALTEAEQETLKAIRAFIKQHEYPPTFSELRQALGVSSKNTIEHRLNRLEEKGYLTRTRRTPRAMTLID